MKLILLLVCLLTGWNIYAQSDKFSLLQEKLIILSNSEMPKLNERVTISVGTVQIQEFLRGVAISSGINLNVDPTLKIEVVNNFTNVKVIDILLFLVKQYNLDISVIGNIINIFNTRTDIPAPIIVPKVLVNYNKEVDLLSIQCDNEDLTNVTREIIDKTGKNIVPAPGIDRIKVSGYIQNLSFENALDKFSFANNLKIRKTDDQVFIIEKSDPIPLVTTSMQQRRANMPGPINQNIGNGNLVHGT